MSVNPDQVIFDAIAAATSYDGGILISTKKFIDTFNGHRDRALCTSLTPEGRHMSNREIEKNEALARIKGLENELANGWQRDRIKALEERIEQLEAALREIADLRYSNTFAASIARVALRDVQTTPPSKD